MFYGFRCRTWEIGNRCLTTAFTTIGIRYRYEIGYANKYFKMAFLKKLCSTSFK